MGPAGWGKDALVEEGGERPEDALIVLQINWASSFVLLNRTNKFSIDYGGDCCCQRLVVRKKSPRPLWFSYHSAPDKGWYPGPQTPGRIFAAATGVTAETRGLRG